MAMFIAQKIIDGTFSYKQIFSFALYKRYQTEVDAILTAEGRTDLIALG